MKTRGNLRRSLVIDDSGDARVGAFFLMSAILTVVMIVAYILAPPPDVGIEEGQLAPDIVSDAYTSGSWEDFRLYDHINRDWEEGQDGTWILLLFIDTDCPHCFNSADKHSQLYSQYGENVMFVSVVVELNIPGHNSDRGEIVDFKEKNSNNDCNSGNSDCKDRPGDAHPWTYVDDLNLRAMENYDIPGTPFYLLLSPDGIVAWNPVQGDARGEEIEQGLYNNIVAVSQ